MEEDIRYGEADRELDETDLSYPILNWRSDLLSYNWIERADEVIKQEVL